jgi:hypothetical protein
MSNLYCLPGRAGGSPGYASYRRRNRIATFTGHSLKDVEAILDAHYLGRDIQLAEAAVQKLEQRTKL